MVMGNEIRFHEIPLKILFVAIQTSKAFKLVDVFKSMHGITLWSYTFFVNAWLNQNILHKVQHFNMDNNIG